jgi:flagellar biosynthetic protein FlhB
MGQYFIGEAHLLIPTETPFHVVLTRASVEGAYMTIPFMLFMVVAGLAVNVAQVGLMLTTKPLQPKWNRINPISGLQKFFSLRSLVDLAKSVAKLGIAGTVVWWYLREQTEELVSLMSYDPWGLLVPVGWMIVGVWWRILVVMVVIAALDFAYQRWQHDRDIRMTQQEVREETKEMEGDPQVKRRIRQLQRQMATQRMMAEVPEAEVVITNPTHYAVALRYDPSNMEAPTVVAKGQNLIAQRIRELAVENQVPIVERPELARTIFRTIEVGDVIPESLFRTVAEVLTFVYRVDRRAHKQRERAKSMGPSGMARAV